MTHVKLTIDGIPVEAANETTLLRAALQAGIHIPNLCADAALEPYGACRLCLVEIEGRAEPQTACTTPVAEGMVVRTDTEALNTLRRHLVELMLSDHPVDCLLCRKNQRCELQRIAAQLGADPARYRRLRRETVVDRSHPFFERDPAKCILCGKCVRVCEEVQGQCALEIFRDGRFSRVVTAGGEGDILHSRCESCGQCVDICPTGALVPKRFEWPSREVRTVCPFCGTGCGVVLAVRGNRVVGARGDRQAPVNRGAHCVKGRFGFEFVNHPERLQRPLIRRDGRLEEAGWDEALSMVADRLRAHAGGQAAVVASARCSNEENYLLQKLARTVLHTNNVDHCARL